MVNVRCNFTFLCISIVPFFTASPAQLRTTAFSEGSEKPLSLKFAKKQFARDKDKLRDAQQRIAKYHESVDGSLSDYEKELQVICQNALPHFMSQKAAPTSAVIFDVDETILSNYQVAQERNFSWTIDDAFEFRLKSTCAALRPVRDFYHALKSHGFKMIILTSRRDSLYAATQKNLTEQGFVYDELILLPMDLFEQGISHGEWKTSVRKSLSEKYNIVGCVGDSDSDFKGGYTGYEVRLPNYLY